MIQTLKLFKLVDGVQSPFPNEDIQIEIFDYTYNAKRMGGAPNISATVHYVECLDEVWDETVHVEFDNEKYFLKQTPTSSKDSNDARYKHEVEFVSERSILDNVYFYDVVSAEYSADKPVSNSSTVAFFGTIHEFVKRMNESLKHSKLQTVVNGEIQGYQIVVDSDITSDGKLITFEDQFFSGVLQEVFNVYELPYYFEGKTIHIGFEQAAINQTFEYGADNELLSITKTNANNRIVNRIAGVGSKDNVPYYYPNESPKGDIAAECYSADGNKKNNAILIDDVQKYSSIIDLNECLTYDKREIDAVQINKCSIEFGYYNAYDEWVGNRIGNYTPNSIIEYNKKFCDFFATVSVILDFTVSSKFAEETILKIKYSKEDGSINTIDTNAFGDFVDLTRSSSAIKDVSTLIDDDGWINIVIKNLYEGRFVIAYNFYSSKIISYTNDGIATNSLFRVNYVGKESIEEYAWSNDKLKLWINDLREVGLTSSNQYTPSLGDYIKQVQTKYVNPQDAIMPSIYRDTNGAERFYNAINYGNKNLLLSSWTVLENRNYLLGSYDIGSVKPTNGQIVTLSFSGYFGDGHGRFKIYNSGWTVYQDFISANDYNYNTNRYEHTFEWIEGSADNSSIYLFQSDGDDNRIDEGDALNENRHSSRVYDIKLEFGDKATKYVDNVEEGKIASAYINEETGEFYEFVNPYVEGYPKEVAVEFAEIKPTIVGMKNADGFPLDIFSEFAYDEDDNDETEEIDGTLYYKHPMFFGKLRKFDGPNGFNLFDSAIENGEMEISVTSGHCGGCKFTIQVSDDDLNQNLVQVYEEDVYDDDNNLIHAKGSLKRDENGNVICGRGPYQPSVAGQKCQQDTINNEVWVALKKDIDTFGVLMPVASKTDENGNITHIGIKPLAYSEDADGTQHGDTFVILNILLPKGYITDAEDRLSKEIIKYLKENNEEKFTFSIKLSRIYLAQNPNITQQLNENSLIHVIYNNHTYPLYVSSYSYKVSHDESLPEITVELSDKITVSEDVLTSTISEVKGDIKNAFTNIDIIGLASPHFLRKDVDDRSKGKISASMGFEAGGYTEGKSGAKIDEYGKSEFESVNVRDTITANSVKSNIFTTPTFIRGLLGGEGGRFWVDENGKANIEVDNITARQGLKVTEIVVQKVNSVGGQLIVSAANGQVQEVINNHIEKDGALVIDTVTIVFNGDATFMNNDIIRCSYWDNGANQLRSYWVAVSVDGDIASNRVTIKYSDLKEGYLPRVGDKVAQMGNTTNTERQGLIIISTENSKPFISIYDGVNTTSLTNANLKGRFGDLSGITFNGKALSGYGIWSDNAYLNGELNVKSTGKTIEDEINSQIAANASDRNYARLTAIPANITSVQMGANITKHIYDVYGFTNNDEITISFDWESKGVEIVDPTNSFIFMQFGEKYGYATSGFKINDFPSDVISRGSFANTITLTGGWDSSTSTATLPISPTDNGQLTLRFDNVYMSDDAYFKVSNLRVNKGNISHDWQAAPEDAKAELDSYKNVVTEQLENLQNQVDGQVTSWFYDYVPTKENAPAKDWNTTALKDAHIGDTFTNIQTFIDNETTPNAGKSWRWLNGDRGYDWYIIADSDATKALLLASQAQDTADGKRRVFVNQPTDSDAYDVGDLWVNATYGEYTNEFLRCKNAKEKNIIFSISDWEKASKYTDDTAINNLQIGGRNLLIGTNRGMENWTFGSSLGVRDYIIKESDEILGYRGVQIIKESETAVGQNGWEVFLYDLNPKRIEKDKTYHLSFDAMQGAIGENIPLSFRANLCLTTGGEPLCEWVTFNIVAADSTWHHYDIELVATENGIVGGEQSVYITNAKKDVDWLDISFANLKLEEGTKSTPWSPAPEDVQADIAGVQTDLTSFKSTTETNFSVLEDKIESSVTETKNYVDGKIETVNTTIEQTANEINLIVTETKSDLDGVKTGLSETGINIETGEITVKANKFQVTNNDNEPTLSVDAEGNLMTNVLQALGTDGNPLISANVNNSGYLTFYYPNTTQRQLEMGWDSESESLMRYYDEIDNMLWKIGSASAFLTSDYKEWEVISLYKCTGYNFNFTPDLMLEEFNSYGYSTYANRLMNLQDVTLTPYFKRNVINSDPEYYEGNSVNSTKLNGWFTTMESWMLIDVGGTTIYRIFYYYKNGKLEYANTFFYDSESSDRNVWIS